MHEVLLRCEATELQLAAGQGSDPWVKSLPVNQSQSTLWQRMLSLHILQASETRHPRNWGFVVSDFFKGTVFWHVVDNPEMVERLRQNLPPYRTSWHIPGATSHLAGPGVLSG